MQIIVNDIILDFDGKIRIKLNSPILSDTRTFTYEFDIKSTPTNDRAFGFARLPHSIVNSIQYTDFCIVSDMFIFNGTLTLRSTSDEGYKVYFVAESLQGSVKNYKLRNISDEIIYSEERAKPSRNNDFLYIFPEIYFSGANDQASQFNFERYYDYSVQYTPSGSGPRVPGFYIKKLLNKIFDSFEIKYNYQLDDIAEDFNDLMLLSNTPVDSFYLTEDASIFNLSVYSIASDFWLDENNVKYKDIIIFLDAPLEFEFPDEILTKFVHLKESENNSWPYHNKFFTIEKLREESSTYKSALYKFKNADVPVLENYFRVDAQDPDYVIKGTKTQKGTYNNQKAGFFLPDITAGELIKAIEDLLFIKFIFDDVRKTVDIMKLKNIILENTCENINEFRVSNSKLEIKDNKGFYLGFAGISDNYFTDNNKKIESRHVLKSSVSSKSNLPTDASVNDLRLVQDINAFYEYVENEWLVQQESGVVGSWHFFSHNIFMTNNDSATFSIESKAVPLSFTNDIKWKLLDDEIPYFSCAYGGDINFMDLKQENSFKDVRVFFFRGFVTDLNYTLPWQPNAVISDKNTRGEKINYANLSLDYTAYENSIPARCANEWANFQCSRKDLELLIIWPHNFLNNPEWTKKRALQGDLYFIVSVDLEITSDDKINYSNTMLAKC